MSMPAVVRRTRIQENPEVISTFSGKENTEIDPSIIDQIRVFFENTDKKNMDFESRAIHIQKHTIIFNLGDHQSLLAAVLTSLVLKKYGHYVILQDIRDAFQGDVDILTLIGVGDLDDYQNYYQNFLKNRSSILEEKALFKRLESHHTSLMEGDGQSLLHNAIENLLMRFPEDRDINRMWRFVIPAECFYSREMDAISLERYLRVLKLAYGTYLGHETTLGEIIDLEPMLDEHSALVSLKDMRPAFESFRSRMEEVIHDGMSYLMLTSIGPDIYQMLRRVKLARREFIHATTGMYGQVVFSSIPVRLKAQDVNERLFYITPEEMPLDAHGRRAGYDLNR